MRAFLVQSLGALHARCASLAQWRMSWSRRVAIAAGLLLAALAVTSYAFAPVGQPRPNRSTRFLQPGPWGVISMRRVVIAPPIEQIDEATFSPAPIWHFRDTSSTELVSLFAESHLADEQIEALMRVTRRDPANEGYIVEPPAALLRSLTADARARIYHRLARDRRNLAQVNAFRFWGDSPAQWMERADLSPRLREAVAPLVYRNGSFLFFADLPQVQSHLSDVAEGQRLVQALMGESTLMLRLHVAEGQDVEPLVAYWGGRGRAKDVRTILQSLANTPGGGSIDVVHLLPPFARARLYTYPDDDGVLPAGDTRDCHWSALNFFNRRADDRFANGTYVSQVFTTQYTTVDQPQFGDLVVFMNDGEIYHTAVYIADNVLFTKNGARMCRPWMLLPMSAMRDFYPTPDPIEIRYLRRIATDVGSSVSDAM